MSIRSNLDTFCDKNVLDFSIQSGTLDFTNHVYRLRLSHDQEIGNGKSIEKVIDTFVRKRGVAAAQALIIGLWDEDSESNQFLVHKLVAVKNRLKNIKALFMGDITYEEQEISWIQQSDLSPIWAAYPQLEFLQIRGGNNLSLGTLHHPNLKTLIIETGGLPPNVITEISNAHLPKLEKLELWLGSDWYGFNSKIEDFETLINGGKFPKLKYLGLKNSIIQDEIAVQIAHSPILDQLETLDLSMGLLSDIGAQALLDSPKIKKLSFLNLNHHYLSDGIMERLNELGIPISMNNQCSEHEDGTRYVEVSE